jgi:hypothetical protein
LRDHRAAGAICERMKDTVKVSHMANYCTCLISCQVN